MVLVVRRETGLHKFLPTTCVASTVEHMPTDTSGVIHDWIYDTFPGDGLEIPTDAQRDQADTIIADQAKRWNEQARTIARVSEVTGRPTNIAYLRSQLRRWWRGPAHIAAEQESPAGRDNSMYRHEIIAAALRDLTRASGRERNFKSDELEHYVRLAGSTFDVATAINSAIEKAGL